MSVLPSLLNPYGGLGLYYTSPPAWIAVRQRLTQFHRNLSLPVLQHADGLIKRNVIGHCGRC